MSFIWIFGVLGIYNFGCYVKKNVAFTLISFAVHKWDDCLSIASRANWLDQTVNELEFELSRM